MHVSERIPLVATHLGKMRKKNSEEQKTIKMCSCTMSVREPHRKRPKNKKLNCAVEGEDASSARIITAENLNLKSEVWDESQDCYTNASKARRIWGKKRPAGLDIFYPLMTPMWRGRLCNRQRKHREVSGGEVDLSVSPLKKNPILVRPQNNYPTQSST